MFGKRLSRNEKESLDSKSSNTHHKIGNMDNQSLIDPTRNTVGSIYRDAQINGEQGVVIGDVNHEIKKDLVKDINEAIVAGQKEMGDKPFYLAIYEKYDLMLKKGLVRIRKITKYRPYPEQDSMVFHVYPNNDVYFCWELPHRSQMMNILMNPDLYPHSQVEMIRRWENIQLEHFGFTKDEVGNWVENMLFRGDFLLGSDDGQKKVKILTV
jgi:hypothetical protein